MRNAFTLIELLVVIAIIAILAAILFPVFSQAKVAAKRTAYLSQSKQAGTAIIIYLSDYDDLMPLGTVPDLTQTIQPSYRNSANYSASPDNWCNLASQPTLQRESALVWHNATNPYRKNYEMLNPGNDRRTFSSGTLAGCFASGARVAEPKGSNFSYNGFLQGMSQNSFTAISKLTMIWPGMGTYTYDGFVAVSPRLNCPIQGVVCQYNPAGRPQDAPSGSAYGMAFEIEGPSWHAFGQGSVHVMADTSAKYIPYGNGNQSSGNERLRAQQPWQFLNSKGQIPAVPGAFIRGWIAGPTFYPAAFVPDNPFDGTTG
ncbi:MAG: prepilin-type N-terminal cleavage/methylation domain-containing protein [Armatimonadetes bacterium]|nr:prepilin-type N-terminal cleavage/methylation domain-containing protein [Armatimonadota bacterium]MBS1710853.1 prepilin-type N-terminal cleavage/methylation domain-containing protein [Armatimonadota bacterium]